MGTSAPRTMFRHLPVPGQVVVIALSIFMAFWVDRAWDWRQDRVEEREVLVGLDAEFSAYATELDDRIERWDSIRAEVAPLFEGGPDRAELSEDVVRRGLSAVLNSSTYEPGNGVRDALIAAGRLDVIRDTDLRRALVAWEGVLAEVQDNEIVMREFILGELIPYMANRGAPVGLLESGVPSGLAPAAEFTTMRALLRDPGFLALAGVRYGWLASSIAEYRTARIFVEDVLALVREDSDALR